MRNLLVLVIPVEGLDIELQPVVQEPVLAADGVGGQPFGAEKFRPSAEKSTPDLKPVETVA